MKNLNIKKLAIACAFSFAAITSNNVSAAEVKSVSCMSELDKLTVKIKTDFVNDTYYVRLFKSGGGTQTFSQSGGLYSIITIGANVNIDPSDTLDIWNDNLTFFETWPCE